MNLYGELAYEIANDEFSHLTGSEYTGQVTSISGWLSGHLGDLNILLHESFSGEAPEEINEEAQSIFKLAYMHKFYQKKMNDTLRGIDSSVDWQVIREGDSSITRTNKNEVAKSWRGLANDTKADLDKLVESYKIYEAAPVEVYDYEN